VTPWIAQIVTVLEGNKLDAIFVRDGAAAITGQPTLSIDLLIRDTPTHRVRIQAVAKALGCTQVPLSPIVRAIQLVGGPQIIHVLFGPLGSESYGAVRARAAHIGNALVAS
jgi:hypothetical protein